MSRTLPEINIYGDPFYVDIRLGEIRKKDAPYNSISFDQMEASGDGYHYRFWYDPKNKAHFPITPGTRKVPAQAVCLEIPYEIKLDPVGVAQKYGLDQPAFLRQYPVSSELKATLIAREQTNIDQFLAARKRPRIVQNQPPKKRGL